MVFRPTVMEVDLDNLKHNYRAIRKMVGTSCQVFGVIKGDAYGMGMVPVARALIQAGCQRFAVASPDEAIALREAGISDPVLILGPSPEEAASELVRLDITSTVTDPGFAEAVNRAACGQGRLARVHLKVDTGMGRIGFLPDELDRILDSLSLMSGLDLEGVFTHFATADEPGEAYVRKQFRRYGDVMGRLRVRGQVPRLRHVCNSAATLRFPEMRLDAVRPGLILYGMWPADVCPRRLELRPVFRLLSRVALVREIPPERGISYGLHYMTRGDEKIAVIPVGYHDGYRRVLSNRGVVLIRGQRAPVVGTVCMDQTLVNVTHIEGVCTGDEVVLLGHQGAGTISPEEFASLLGTINYEVPGLFTPRVVRIYKDRESESSS